MNKLRRPLVAGNWKMHHGGSLGVALASACARLSATAPNVDLVIAPPFTALAAASHECEGTRVAVAGQNMHALDSGAFTGEISPVMLSECGCTWVILGHSERRQWFGETDAVVAEKTRAAFAHSLRPIVCVGETLPEREAGKALETVRRQLEPLAEILRSTSTEFAIAYEPVWAIGTGKNAGPKEAEEIQSMVRSWLLELSPELANRTRILYGGSLKPENAKDLLGAPNVDGGLIGGASLDVGSFGAIALVAQELTRA